MDLNQARFNMIEQQIRPWEVLDPQVLELLSVVRREDFVPPAHQALAFVDMEIPLGSQPGQVMLAPRVQARLVQDLAVRKTDKVLGCHMVGPDAGEIVQGLAIALKAGATKRDFDDTIGVHPTAAEEFVTMRTPVGA